MEISKFEKGSFWGVIIPGGFLYANIFFVFYREILERLLSQSGLFVVLSLLLSYIFGNILKLIQPRVAELLSVPIQFIFSFSLRILDMFRRLFKIKERSWLRPQSSQWILEDFPYIKWFYLIYLKQLPDKVNTFFNNYKKNEFFDNLDQMGAAFFNYCKHYTIENTNHLGDELYFHEGLMRFLNGMVYAIIFSIAAIIIKSIPLRFEYQPFNLVLIMYLIILLIILVRYKTVRRLETVACFMSFYIAHNNKIDHNQDLDESKFKSITHF